MNNIKSRQEWLLASCKDNILKNKQDLVTSHYMYMFSRTQMMFEYDNLPETIPFRDLELLLQVNGHVTITKVKDNLYALFGQLGGEPNPYYLPTISVVANPALKFSKELTIDKDCVVIRNDSCYYGLTAMFNKYANLLAECEISLRFASINSRIPSIIQADNDATKEDAKQLLKDLEEGKQIGVVGSNSFFEGLSAYDYGAKSTNIKDLLELMQYIKAHWYNDLGIRANYNMKREAISAGEMTFNDDMMLPLIDDMLKEREEGVERVNNMFGTNIKVRLSNVWKNLREEMITALELEKAQVDKVESEAEQPDVKEDDNNDTNSE